ncbi:regulator of chromosome condensation 1/beta-lactamase-inhibitor protein II, partial [Baffinella frigidus]
VVTVASGSFHSLAITESLDLYSWGWNNDGQLGMGPLELRPNIPYPTKVVYFDSKVKVKIVKISAGFAHTAAVTADGELYTWGNNRYGQLGLGDYVARRFPSLVTGFIDSRGAEFKVADVKCGLYHCLVQTTAGSIWSFGSNSRGQLGTCKFAPFATDNLDLDCIPEPAQDKEVKPYTLNLNPNP